MEPRIDPIRSEPASEILAEPPSLLGSLFVVAATVLIGAAVVLLAFGEVETFVRAEGRLAPGPGKALVFRGILPSRSTAFVQPGSTARVRVDAYPAERWGTVPGRVLDLAPADEGGFVVRIELEGRRTERGGRIFAGLESRAEILVGRPRISRLLFGEEAAER
jgi:hypothetical protein